MKKIENIKLVPIYPDKYRVTNLSSYRGMIVNRNGYLTCTERLATELKIVKGKYLQFSTHDSRWFMRVDSHLGIRLSIYGAYHRYRVKLGENLLRVICGNIGVRSNNSATIYVSENKISNDGELWYELLGED